MIVIGLDGYENSLGEKLMASGEMPSLKRLSDQSARFLLDHGPAKRTGLAWEHFSTGLSPSKAKRWSAVSFDPNTYRVEQKGTNLVPFPANLSAKTVVFDLPYFDLSKAPEVQGLTAWGAHDAGTNRASCPASLLDEATEMFGPYPATKWIYGFAWPSPERCAEMGESLVRAVQQRAEMTKWLFGDRLRNWDLGIVVVSELHSAVESLWHGVDEAHPLHQHPSAKAAGKSLLDVYKAVDKLIGDLAEAFEGRDMVVFNMHGMGPNQSDVPSMLLLPELMYRSAFGKPFFEEPEVWASTPGGVPMIAETDHWRIAMPDTRDLRERIGDFVNRKIPRPLQHLINDNGDKSRPRRKSSLAWMPAARYQPFWRDMSAFALPSYYDGSVRINLAGRERHGLVPIQSYESECQKIVEMLNQCRDPFTGKAVVDHVEHYGRDDPLDLHQTQGDLIIVWKGAPLAFEHPDLGRIGPVPFRRTGGHTGHLGKAYVKCNALAPGDYGTRSSFDVVPTLLDLLHQPVPSEIDGTSLIVEA
jgi:predicted AlkP superfamily phosphohydrolase/phosphomutase